MESNKSRIEKQVQNLKMSLKGVTPIPIMLVTGFFKHKFP